MTAFQLDYLATCRMELLKIMRETKKDREFSEDNKDLYPKSIVCVLESHHSFSRGIP